KRLKPEHRRHIPGVISYCRAKFGQQVPFDYGFHLDDAALYCLELTENAFRSQGMALSQPVRIGDWEHLTSYPLTAFAIQYGTRLVLERPITLEQTVYLPGNERQGVWGSPLLETVVGPEPKQDREAALSQDSRLNLRGDLERLALNPGRRAIVNHGRAILDGNDPGMRERASRGLGDEPAERKHAPQGPGIAEPEDDISLSQDATAPAATLRHRLVRGQWWKLSRQPGAGRGWTPEIARPPRRFHPVGRFRRSLLVIP
ncbi:MAG: hypothetical protein ABSE84_19530, partial [Isosphaeraceae bacterium]